MTTTDSQSPYGGGHYTDDDDWGPEDFGESPYGESTVGATSPPDAGCRTCGSQSRSGRNAGRNPVSSGMVIEWCQDEWHDRDSSDSGSDNADLSDRLTDARSNLDRLRDGLVRRGFAPGDPAATTWGDAAVDAWAVDQALSIIDVLRRDRGAAPDSGSGS